MSQRLLRWALAWIEENIPPVTNPDIESHEAGFTGLETEEERERLVPR